MKKFGRRRAARTEQPAGVPADSPYAAMCWVMQPASSQPIAAAELAVIDGQLQVISDAPPDVMPAQQQLERLAQIDVWGTDVDLLFVEAGTSLALTTLRFPADDQIELFLTNIVGAYEKSVGTTFPNAWLCVHESRDRFED